jgi:hypothetical protein
MDALGIVDEELIDVVGYAFLARCQSILHATDAHAGLIICPECGALESCVRGKRGIAARCSIASNAGGTCAGSTISKATNTSILFGGGAMALHVEYVERFKAATTPQQKMLAIDRLVHAYHRELVHAPGRSAVRELIYASNYEDLLRFLDTLSYGEWSTPGLQAAKQEWDRKLASSTDTASWAFSIGTVRRRLCYALQVSNVIEALQSPAGAVESPDGD